MSFIEKTEVYKGTTVGAAQTGCWALSLFAHVRAMRNIHENLDVELYVHDWP